MILKFEFHSLYFTEGLRNANAREQADQGGRLPQSLADVSADLEASVERGGHGKKHQNRCS
jgi:hypothetical protein